MVVRLSLRSVEWHLVPLIEDSGQRVWFHGGHESVIRFAPHAPALMTVFTQTFVPRIQRTCALCSRR